MPNPIVTRRTFLTATAMGAAAVVSGCATPLLTAQPTFTPNPSPLVNGPYQVGQVVLGEDPGITALPQPLTPGQFPSGDAMYDVCQDGETIRTALPTSVKAIVYYPYNPRDHRPVPTPNPLQLTTGPFPVLLYAHAFRSATLPTGGCPIPDRTQDFKSVDFMLRHVASYGCVCVAPDLSFVYSYTDTEANLQVAFDQRAVVLVAYYAYLATLNDTLFAGQVDLSRVILVGHSTGGGGTVHAGRIIAGFSHPKSLAYGLIAPFLGGFNGSTTPSLASISTDVRNLLVLYGTEDLIGKVLGHPAAAYAAGGTPKTLVTIPGANHFGFTSLCPPDNSCGSAGLGDPNGTIARASQQQVGAAYLAALVRYHTLNDATARPYLTGERMVEGLGLYGVSGIQVQAEGFRPRPNLTPRTNP
jgi:acetyl esterase/lipase